MCDNSTLGKASRSGTVDYNVANVGATTKTLTLTALQGVKQSSYNSDMSKLESK